MKNNLAQRIVLFLILISCLSLASLFLVAKQASSRLIPELQKLIKEETLLDVQVASIKFDWLALYKLKPTLIITKLKVTEGLTIEKIKIRIYLKSLFQKSLFIKEIIVDSANIILDTNPKQELQARGLDLASIQKHFAERHPPQPNNLELHAIKLKLFKLSNTKITIYPYPQNQPIILNDINVTLKDLVISQENQLLAKLIAKANIYGSKRSKLELNGDLGPIAIDFQELPIKGKLKLKLFIDDIPQNKKPSLVISNHASITLNSDFIGDLLDSFTSSGQVELNGLKIGDNNNEALKISSTVPLSTIHRLAKNPSTTIQISHGLLELESPSGKKGSLKLNANIYQAIPSMYTNLSASGSLEGLEINEALAAISTHKDLINGVFAIDKFALSSSGQSPEAMNKSFTAEGHISIKNGSLYLL